MGPSRPQHLTRLATEDGAALRLVVSQTSGNLRVWLQTLNTKTLNPKTTKTLKPKLALLTIESGSTLNHCTHDGHCCYYYYYYRY